VSTRCPEIQKLVAELAQVKEVGHVKEQRKEVSEEDRLKKYIESTVSTIMRIKNIKPELHRQ